VDIPRDPARRAAEDELSRPRYHQDEPGLLERLLDWIWENLSRLLRSAADVSPGGAVGLAVLVALVVLLGFVLWSRFGTPRRTASATARTLFESGPRSAADHRAAAEAHAAAGRWSEAVQERMRALVRGLEERALLEPRPGRTADEAADEAGQALPAHTDALRAAARTFDEVTYAGRAADQAAYTLLRELDDTVGRTRPGTTGLPAAPARTAGGAR
jgi:hypothetical protein